MALRRGLKIKNGKELMKWSLQSQVWHLANLYKSENGKLLMRWSHESQVWQLEDQNKSENGKN